MQTLVLALSLMAAGAPPANEGRFQLLQLGTMRRDQYLLDSHTGKIWARVCMRSASQEAGDCAYQAWLVEDIEGITASMADIRKTAQ